jgi:hypothetical protein
MNKIDNQSENLLLISYPSGGYGFYLTRLINYFVTNVVSTTDSFLFDDLGTSHSLPLVVGDIHFEKNRTLTVGVEAYQFDIDQQKYILIPYCPGINSDNPNNVIDMFPNAKIIRLFYQDNTWPLVFQNCIVKAATGNTEDDIEFDAEIFGSSDAWARRENFELLFKNHHYRTMWKQHDTVLNIDIFTLLTDPQHCLHQIAGLINGSVTRMDELAIKHQQFLDANPNTVRHLEILDIVKSLAKDQDLSHINQLYQQAVLNFYIQLKFNFVIPSNDYANWFTNTKQIVTMLNNHEVKI